MTSGLPGAPQTTYYLVVNDPFGERLGLVTDYESFDVTRSVNNLGTLVFTVPQENYSDDTFPIDGLVELWRAPLNGAPSLFLETLWFIREVFKDFRGGRRIWRITCYDLLYLLGDPDGQRGRIIAYNAGNAFTDKVDFADDMAKTLIRENLGTLAADTDRDLSAYLSVAADAGLGALMRKSDMSRRLVLPVLQEIAEASAAAGSYLAFDIVCVTPPSQGTVSLEFRTYTGQRGQDHRFSSGVPVLIGPDFGNMDEAEFGRSHTAEANYIYARGQSVGNIAAIEPASDPARIGISPFNRRETLVDAGSTLDLEALQAEANAGLRAGRPRQMLDARIIDSDQARLGVEWNWGDYLPAQVDGYTFDCRVESIDVRFSQNGEEIQGRVRFDDIT